MNGKSQVVVCQIVGYKNSGKTTLVCKLVEILTSRGFRAAVIKHDAHDFDIDLPGTDSYRHRKSGAGAIALVSSRRTAVIEEKETSLEVLIRQFSGYDYILVEGFKNENYPKLIMVREPDDRSLIQQLSSVRGIISWLPEDVKKGEIVDHIPKIPVFSKDDVLQVANWLEHLKSL